MEDDWENSSGVVNDCPSILSADFSSLKETLKEMQARAVLFILMSWITILAQSRLRAKLIADLRPHSSLFFDAHLMIDRPEKIQSLSEAERPLPCIMKPRL